MRSWLATSRAALRLAVISFSLLVLGHPAWAGHFADLAARMKAAPSDGAAINLAILDPECNDNPDILRALYDTPTSESGKKKLRERLQTLVELRALPEGATPSVNAEAAAKDVKASAIYRDIGVEEGTNWLGQALARLRNLRFNWNPPQLNAPNAPRFGSWLTYLLWGLLGAAVLFLSYLAFRHVEWKQGLARRAKALLEEDEPEQSLDEWLTSADDLAAQGRYREAVRALYLACLLRFDEGRVARFDRRETNWEHLARIERSPRLPTGLDFRSPTRAFDQIWYGGHTNGMPDVQRFRDWYQSITQAVMEIPK